MSTPFDYDRSEIHRTYDGARCLSTETLQIWMDLVTRLAPPADVHLILDVGCGTGRFLQALARGEAARVVGLDRSVKMLGEGRAKLGAGQTALMCASAEALPVRTGCVDLVFLSMVYHHLADRDLALEEFRRVLRPAGHLLVRTSTAVRLDGYLWLRFFPAARPIELARTPAAAQLVTRAEAHGLALRDHIAVEQPFAANLAAYAEKIGLRGISSLAMLPDEAFEAGMSALRAHSQDHESHQPVCEEIDLFHFVASGESPC